MRSTAPRLPGSRIFSSAAYAPPKFILSNANALSSINAAANTPCGAAVSASLAATASPTRQTRAPPSRADASSAGCFSQASPVKNTVSIRTPLSNASPSSLAPSSTKRPVSRRNARFSRRRT
ncbi:hypothetical protein DRA42_01615 [Ethanoligenens harbinense]|nr:hypothetical protein CXQ68_01605 [Ethanoligenens harbinense YUAN-3]AYF37745.1 hypothetical protein CXP51_01615 [Ethanoligenens harbinense]AYF40466.1 hypothetical protein CN246_01605 [Ethanoligenens harbinense]QCN91301.1 hypothetical protein DRA42_01615 [Ethanoligenens harbinense]